MMKKFMMIAMFLVIFGACGEAKAQLPFPGQSLPVQTGILLDNFLGLDGSTWHKVGLYTYGSPVGNPPTEYYYFYVERWTTKKYPDGHWDYVIFNSTFPDFYYNASALYPNLTSSFVSELDIYNGFGNGQYRTGINIYAYNPYTHVRINVNQVSNGFIINR